MRPTVHGHAGGWGWGWTWTSPAGAPARPLGLLVGELRVRPVDRFAGGLPVWNAPFAAAVMSLPHGALRPELCLCHDCLSSCRWTHAPEAGVKDANYGCGCGKMMALPWWAMQQRLLSPNAPAPGGFSPRKILILVHGGERSNGRSSQQQRGCYGPMGHPDKVSS